ncbi:MAG: response regulator transcription factor [Clostridia bacterium]|nr:response regulator transcription factor [Clostridia bacterium]
MLRFAVCDDEKNYLDIVTTVTRQALSDCGLQATVSAFSNGEELLAKHQSNPYDVLFLDIDMPQISGFEIAQTIRKHSNQPYVVFVTSKHEMVYDSFEFQPFYFICKRTESDLRADVQHVFHKLEPLLKQNKVLHITDNTLGQIALPLKDILYIQSEKHYLFYYRASDSIPLKERGILSEREDELKEFDFFKPHRRYLVNMKHVNRFDLMLHAITMTDGTCIPISKALKKEVFGTYKKFMRR